MTDTPLDHAHDVSGRETHRLTTLYSAPDFVKSANDVRLNGGVDMPRHMYADQKNKLYPCHTAPATWMSALFFADKQSQFSKEAADVIRQRIHKAGKYFGIAGLITELETKVAAQAVTTLNDLPDTDFAIVWRADSGEVERHWPLRNAKEVKFAAAHFKRYRDDFTFDDRHVIANKILDKAAEYAADISDADGTLEISAGFGMCAAKTASQMLRDRAQMTRTKHRDLSEELLKLAEVVDNNPEKARELDTRLKVASVVDAFDRTTQLNRLYDAGGLPRPEEVLFAVTEKVARDFVNQNVETVTGNVYALDDLEKLAVDDVRSWLGDDFADAVSSGGVFMDRNKLAAIVPTLDRGMAAMLDRLMNEKAAGVVVKSAAFEPLLAPDRLFDLARDA